MHERGQGWGTMVTSKSLRRARHEVDLGSSKSAVIGPGAPGGRQDALVKQADDQSRVAGGGPVEWLVAEEKSLVAMRRLLEDEDIRGIKFKHVP